MSEQVVQVQQVEQAKLHSILLTVLVPLIFGILLSTLLSVLIILILSPYWASQGGNDLVQQQYLYQSSITTVFGNSQQKIIQKLSTIRQQLSGCIWNNIQYNQYDQVYQQYIDDLTANNLFLIGMDVTQIPYYDNVQQQCTYCMGWGIVSMLDNTLQQSITQLSQLSISQQSTIKIVISAFPLMQSIYMNNINIIDYLYVHNVEQVFLQYPYQPNRIYSQSILNVMQQQFDPRNSSSMYRWQLGQNDQAESCVAIVQTGNIFFGIMCIGISQQGLTDVVKQMMPPSSGDVIAILANPQLTVFSTTLQTIKQYPTLSELLFNGNTLGMDQFISKFNDIVYPASSISQILLYSSNYDNTNNQQIMVAFKQIIQNEIGVFQNQTYNPYIQSSTLMIQFNSNTFYTSLNNLSDQIQNDTFMNIMTIAIPIATAMCFFAWCISYRIIQSISKPLNDLQYKLEIITKDSMAIQIYSNYQPSSLEVNQLYDTFHQLVTVLNFSNDRYFEGDDTSLLIKYAQGFLLFERMKSNKGMGMILNNIGNIHRRQGRYQEALQSYRESLQLCEEDIKAIMGDVKISDIYPFYNRQSVIRQSQEQSESDEKRSRSSTNRRVSLVGDRDTLRKQYEDIYSNRNFQLASVLIEYAQQQSEEQEANYQESLDKLRLILFLDQKSNKNQYRQITTKILMCRVLINLGDLDQAAKEIEKAEELSEDYELVYELADMQEYYTVPPGILRQRILYEKGLICLKFKRIKRAAMIFTDCLETSKQYDPEIRQNCLTELRNIFEKQNMLKPLPRIIELLQQTERKKNKDIVIAMDYSGSMENIKKELALKGILKVFDQYLQEEDRISFIRFNQNIEVVFDLTPKMENTAYLRGAIEKSLYECAEGKTALLQAICHGYSIHEKAVYRDNQKWIVALCDGEDNLSNMSFEKMKKFMTSDQRKDVSLIVIGIGLTTECLDELYDLCRVTKNGFMIQSVLSDDLDVAFQSLSNLIFGTSNLYDERLN